MRISALAEYEPSICVDQCGEFCGDEVWWKPAPRPVVTLVPAPAVGPGPLRRLLGLVVEVLDGRRPAVHLHGAMSAEVYTAMLTRVRASSGRAHRLLSMRSCRVSDRAIEVSGVVKVWPAGRPEAWRVAAIVGRLVKEEDAWRFTYLRMIAPAVRRG